MSKQRQTERKRKTIGTSFYKFGEQLAGHWNAYINLLLVNYEVMFTNKPTRRRTNYVKLQLFYHAVDLNDFFEKFLKLQRRHFSSSSTTFQVTLQFFKKFTTFQVILHLFK